MRDTYILLFFYCRFVDLLGGTLWAESVLGKGSAFHFRLPFCPNSPKESPLESPRVKSGFLPYSFLH